MNIKVQIPAIRTYSTPFRKKEVTEKPVPVQTQQGDTFELSVGYVNDIHGQINNMLRILGGLKGDLKLSGGDNTIGDESNKKINRSVMKFLNLADIKATALGNHELDTTQLDAQGKANLETLLGIVYGTAESAEGAADSVPACLPTPMEVVQIMAAAG